MDEKKINKELLEACKLMYRAWEMLLPCLRKSSVPDYELVLNTAPRACTKAIENAERHLEMEELIWKKSSPNA